MATRLDIRQAQNLLYTVAARIPDLELLVEVLTDSASLANRRFLGSIDSYLQVLDAEGQLFDAELELARIRANELLNIVQLYKALGGRWQSDGTAVSAAVSTVPQGQSGSRR